MQIVVDADVHSVDVVPLKQVAEVAVAVANPISGAPSGQLLLVHVRDGNDFCLRDLAPDGHVPVGDDAGANDTNAHFFHGWASFDFCVIEPLYHDGAPQKSIIF